MNKRQIIASLNNIANSLDNSGLYKEANAITKVMIKLADEFNTDDEIYNESLSNQLPENQLPENQSQNNEQSQNVENSKPFITIEVNEYGDINTYTFDGGFTIGRADDNNIVTKIPYISRQHCFIYYTPQYNAWFVQDLDSKSGTFIGRAKIDNKPAVLSKGYSIRLDDNFVVNVVEIYPDPYN